MLKNNLFRLSIVVDGQIDVHVRRKYGVVNLLPINMFAPKPGIEWNDSNKFGAVAESHGLGRVRFWGNVVGRVWKVPYTVELGASEYHKDYHPFVMNGVDYTPLTYRVITDELP